MYFATAYAMTYAIYAVLNPYLSILLRGMGYRPAAVGILLGIFEGAGIAGPFIFGYWADKTREYKTCMVCSQVAVFFSMILLVLFNKMLLTVALLIIIGIGYRSIFPLLDAVTIIGIGTTGNYGKIRIGGSIGFVLMMCLLQLTPWFQPNTPVNISFWAGITIILTISSILIIPAKYTNTSRQSSAVQPDKQEKKETKFWSVTLVVGLIMAAFARFGMTPMSSLFSLFLTEYMHWNVVGFMGAIAAITEIPVLLFSKKIINRIGALPLLALALAAVSVRLLIYALFPTKTGIVIAQLFHSICYGFFYAAGVAFIAACVPPAYRAMGMSLYVSLGTGLPTLIGNMLGGIIIERMGYRALFGIFALVPLIALGIYVLFVLAKKNKRGYIV